MKEYFGNYLGLCINNDDPERRGRVQIFIPHIMPALFENWNEVGEDIKLLCVGDNLPDSLPGPIIEKLKKILPWSESALPIMGGSAAGSLVSSPSYTQGTGENFYDQSPVPDPSGMPAGTDGTAATDGSGLPPSGDPATYNGGGGIIGATSGGVNGDWAGSLGVLSGILPAGTSWNPYSQKRGRAETASGNMSDHYINNTKAYGIDLGLNKSFGGSTARTTQTALQIVNNVQAKLGRPAYTSWSQVKDSRNGRSGSYYETTPDGYRVQVLWQSDKDHYDHIHVGVRNTRA